MTENIKKVLTIAGSDCSGGAGIQADIKTITTHSMYAMSVITALTAQNTLGVTGIYDISPDFVAMQMDSIFTDIVPDSIKIGMLSRSDIIDVIASKLKEYSAENIVLDPVMVATSGSKLLSPEAEKDLKEKLFPLARIITPNIYEAEVLVDMKIESKEDMLEACETLGQKYHTAVLVKGGHLGEEATDMLFYEDRIYEISSDRIENKNTHGTGCTLSSAIACNLAGGFNLVDSVKLAKRYISKLIAAKLDLGRGRGPLDHMCIQREAR